MTGPMPGRRRVWDKSRDCIGEVMPHPVPEHLLNPQAPRSVWLRPVGGGLEWTTLADEIEDVPRGQGHLL